MTIGRFCEELTKTPRTWRFENGTIRCERGACPINAVAYSKDTQYTNLEIYTRSADFLGLSRLARYAIARAADSQHSPFRARLLRACGLSA